MSVSTKPKTYQCPPGIHLDQRMRSRISRVASWATRSYDWDALKLQAGLDPPYKGAQMRYIGTGTCATDVPNDFNAIAAKHFTFSTMIAPAGAEGPLHPRTDAEEAFCMLRGRVKLTAKLDGETWQVEARDRDLTSWQAGAYRGVINIGDEEALTGCGGHLQTNQRNLSADTRAMQGQALKQ